MDITLYSFLTVAFMVLFTLSLVLLWQAWRYRQEQKSVLDELSSEAGLLLDRMRTRREPAAISDNPDMKDMLESPLYLTTLITVLVNKMGGSIRFTEKDFHDIDEDNYVSVFVDTKDGSLLLCMNTIAPPGDPEDSVFH